MLAGQVIKLVIQVVSQASVGTVIGNVVASTAPVTQTIGKKILTGVGGFVLSSMISDCASDYMGKKYDEIAKTFNQKKSEPESK